MTSKSDILCPQCGKKSTLSIQNTYRPFCSERCKMIDLGEWANGEYKIPTTESIPLQDDEADEK